MLDLDKFSSSMQLGIDKGRKNLPSKLGALCTVLLFVILVAFAAYKLDIVGQRKRIDIFQAVYENYFDDAYVFGADQGFNIAAGVYDPTDPRQTSEIDPDYGRIQF